MWNPLFLAFPKRCPLCDEPVYTDWTFGGFPVCRSCREEVFPIEEPACMKCGKPLSEERRELCLDCAKKDHHYTRGKALWLHEGRVRRALYGLKYKNKRQFANTFGQEMALRYGDWICRLKIEAIMPIPLHRSRLRQRGYNQAELIARQLFKSLCEKEAFAGGGMILDTSSLVRYRKTRAQKELDHRQRRENLRRAFVVPAGKLPWKRVLLIDDIYTTGSTIDGAARALKEAGVEEVYFLCVSIGGGL